MNTTNELYSMVCGCFTKVDDAKQYSLKDLSVGGYEKSKIEDIAWVGGCGFGQFQMMVLKNDGNPDKDKTFYWVDCTEGLIFDEPTVYAPGWYKSVDNKPVKMADADVAAIKFDLGQAFWIKGNGMSLVSSGAVSPQRMEFKTDDTLYIAAGNGMPVDCTLGDLYVNGYEESKIVDIAWVGGCGFGQFQMMMLKNDGNPDRDNTFYWVDCTEGLIFDEPTVYEAGWYKSVDNKPVKMTPGEVAAVKIKAGQGFWIKGGKMNLVVPSPLAEEKPAE